ncbi:MAG: glucan biosynthesis protein G [Polaromonas sp.]|nr:glucan biosynthesis protein G [Polaromonas sp.]
MRSFSTSSVTAFGLARSARAALLLAGVLLAGLCQAWTLDDVAKLAQQRAQTPFKPAPKPLPPELAGLDYDGLRDIRFNDDKALWRADKLPYETKFFHVGRQTDSVRIHEVSATGNKPLPYDARDFSFGKNQLHPGSWGDVGHAGFRVHAPLNSTAYKDELVVFLGASYFRALGAGQRYGLSARGLAVDTAGAGSRLEEFPRFTDFWLEKPAADAKELTIYALLDSPRMAGAYRFVIRPGEETVTEVHARVFMRANANPRVATLGLAPLTSMFFFGENQPRSGDFRPEVHDSDGLMIATTDGEWLWRPLQNPNAPIATSFAMKGLKGFGLMQRDRTFASYEDTEARYEARPSAWVTPIGDWGPGRVELLQLPTPDETHDNIAAYWVPERLPQPGESIAFAYALSWQGDKQQRPPNGWVTQSRRGIGFNKLDAATLQQAIPYVVDFAGPALDALKDDAPVRAVVSSDANGRVIESNAYRNPVNGQWRMTLRVQRIDPAKPIELRAFLQHNNHTVSETWTTLVTP